MTEIADLSFQVLSGNYTAAHVPGSVTAFDDREIDIAPDEDGELVAYVFKTLADPYAGRLNLFRVHSGVLKGDSQVTNASRRAKERIGQLLVSQGKEHEQVSAVERTAELSDEILTSLEAGQRAALEAVTKFVDTVDQALPALGERPSRRQEIVDAAMEMADRLVHTQYDFLRKVVRDAGKSLSRSENGK